jgi:putative spermidine/putrescine transport system permease protein
VVVVYNNVVARLRRLGRSLEEASMDLGADTWQTFRRITLPAITTALFAGALLAFALSFDEIIVTTFTSGTEQTLPIWMFANFRLPNARPTVNVVALVMILLSLIPVYISARLAGAESVDSARGRASSGAKLRGRATIPACPRPPSTSTPRAPASWPSAAASWRSSACPSRARAR